MLRQDVETMMQHAFEALGPDPQDARGLIMVPPILVTKGALPIPSSVEPVRPPNRPPPRSSSGEVARAARSKL